MSDRNVIVVSDEFLAQAVIDIRELLMPSNDGPIHGPWLRQVEANDFLAVLRGRLADALAAFEQGWPDHCGCC